MAHVGWVEFAKFRLGNCLPLKEGTFCWDDDGLHMPKRDEQKARLLLLMITCKWKSLVVNEIFISPQDEPTLRIISVGYIRGDVAWFFFQRTLDARFFDFCHSNHERFNDQTCKD